MRSGPDRRLLDPRDPLRALMLLTRIPAPGADGTRAAASAWAWPVVGLIVGAMSGILAWIALLAGLPAAVAAGIALGAGIGVTGAMHEDGLADCADGFWGAFEPETRLDIMKDSRIGSYGVLALILVIGLKWLALAALIDAGALWMAVLVPAMLSRGAMAGMMAGLPFARDGGLARHVGRPSGWTAGVAFGLAALATVAMAALAGVVAVIAVIVVSGALARLARSKIGGQTGDVLGAAQQLAELTALFALTASVSA
jgi:adenosylcobinamide-GDP ribazoletransferase